MKQLIREVLDEMSEGHINLESEASRELIANTIMAAIKTNNGRKGWVLDLSTFDGGSKLDTPIYEKSDEQKARESWVCSICGKNTYDVDWDYIGSDTNHLGCELEHEKRVSSDRRKKTFGSTPDRRKSDRREKNWSQKKHEDKVFNHQLTNDREYPYNSFVRSKEDLQKQVYAEMTTDGLPEGGDSQAVIDSKAWVDKLTEEIVSDNDTGYIYESPDGGKTVYKRKEGSDKRELVKDWEKRNKEER